MLDLFDKEGAPIASIAEHRLSRPLVSAGRPLTCGLSPTQSAGSVGSWVPAGYPLVRFRLLPTAREQTRAPRTRPSTAAPPRPRPRRRRSSPTSSDSTARGSAGWPRRHRRRPGIVGARPGHRGWADLPTRGDELHHFGGTPAAVAEARGPRSRRPGAALPAAVDAGPGRLPDPGEPNRPHAACSLAATAPTAGIHSEFRSAR